MIETELIFKKHLYWQLKKYDLSIKQTEEIVELFFTLNKELFRMNKNLLEIAQNALSTTSNITGIKVPDGY